MTTVGEALDRRCQWLTEQAEMSDASRAQTLSGPGGRLEVRHDCGASPVALRVCTLGAA